jgi:cyclopropane fatty-acyl-phospholipid synthase-like methyltransferase
MCDVASESECGVQVYWGHSIERSTLPFLDEQFDMVVACEVLPHLLETEIGPTLQELSRILSDDGVLAAFVSPDSHRHYGHSTEHDYEKLLSDSGFRIICDTGIAGYRFLLAEKEGVDGTESGNGTPRGHFAVTQDEVVEALAGHRKSTADGTGG